MSSISGVFNLRPPAASIHKPESVSAVDALNIKDNERQLIIDALLECSGNKRDAAALLGIDLSTLYRKIKTYRITKDEFR